MYVLISSGNYTHVDLQAGNSAPTGMELVF